MGTGEDPQKEPAVLRLVHHIYYKADLPLPVQLEAFRPTDKDQDGLSVFLAEQATPEQALAVVPQSKRHNYYIARILVSDLTRLGLSIHPSPISEAPGHHVIPEINSTDYNRNSDSRVAGKILQRELARLAGQNIVHSATNQPPT